MKINFISMHPAQISFSTFIFLLSVMFSLSAQAAQVETVIDNTVQLPSGEIFYRDSGGAGIPVVFLHAGSGNSMMWEYQIPAFTSAGYRFIALDYRGVGAAPGSPATDTSTRISELVALLGLDKFHLVGTAAGGGAALQYALVQRDQLRSITIANSIGNVQDGDYVAMGRRIRPPQFNQLPLDMRELGPSYRAANPAGVARWLALAGEDRLAAAVAPAQTANVSSTAAAATAPDAVTWARLETLTIPALFITGAADLYTPPSVLRMFTDHIKHAEARVIIESGHSAFWESPEEFNNLVLEFIGRH